ncbi:MAG: hypothetical protein K0R54_3778 [Clostridiaceae bacterium]|jgi:uncharacterized protein (DUF342 family)|nr:hypothetical protein [Clostridiaceae bacterium]
MNNFMNYLRGIIMERVFKGKSVEECVNEACKVLNIPKDQLDYVVTEEKKGFLFKSASIKVSLKENEKSEEQQKTKKSDENNGKVKITEGKIIVKNPKDQGYPAAVFPSRNVKVIVNGEEAKARKEVFEDSKIEVIMLEDEAQRFMDINLSPDAMEAYITIKYKPKNIYSLVDVEESNTIEIKCKLANSVLPKKFTVDDVKKELAKQKIVFGLINENIEALINGEEDKSLLVAKGEKPQDEQDDILDIKFKQDTENLVPDEDEFGKVDFKSIGSVDSVEKGYILAVKTPGLEGKNGKDIRGKIVKFKAGRKISIKNGTGCTLKDSNTIIADEGGKPCIKNNTFYVYPVHELKSDVDLKSGNIKFMGDIIIYGNVMDGMIVESGNAVTIHGNVERAKVTGKGEGLIKGSIISSQILIGGEDVMIQNLISNLEALKQELSSLSKVAEEIKKFNLLGPDRKDGEIVKVLIETKFKHIPRLCMKVVAGIMSEKKKEEDELLAVIKGKLIGLAPINMAHYWEVDEIVNIIQDKIEQFKSILAIPVNLRIAYCQDSTLESSGDIYIYGKGEYVSNIKGNGKIIFEGEKAITRGGVIQANDEIRCKMVGSMGGVTTKLCASRTGHIWADVAYQNTIFVIGNREYILDTPSKEIHAYLGKDEDIIVDRFKL